SSRGPAGLTRGDAAIQEIVGRPAAPGLLRSARNGTAAVDNRLSQFAQVCGRLLTERPPGADHAERDGDRKAPARGGERGPPIKDETELHDALDGPPGGERSRRDPESRGRRAQKGVF